jgi:1-deoxy-D-xylulose-5-phosphate synthase
MNGYPLLNTLNLPNDLRGLDLRQLQQLCAEIRAFIPETTKDKEGHILASLGVTELTVALHHILNTPVDILIWDVGHQAYVHKILTGRLHQFHTNRKFGGISGFPAPSESPYDVFGTGHASTSLSALGGMAVAAKLQKNKLRLVAVIGDGALTGGMAFEALNHLSTLDIDMTIVLNDNQMAIEENVGALNQLGSYQAYFQSLGIPCSPPVDGHSLSELIPALREACSQPNIKVVHVKTKRPQTAPSTQGSKALAIPLQDVFAEALIRLASNDSRITAITPAMLSGCSLDKFQKLFPERTFDTGITEQHAVTFAAGQAVAGLRPVVNIYSTFAQRAYDQIIHDVALQKLPVLFCIERAGLVGEDGPTHHGAFDLAFLRCIPNLVVTAPESAEELQCLMHTALESNQPFSIRYPKTSVPTAASQQLPIVQLPIGKAIEKQKGKGVVLLSTGFLGALVSDILAQQPTWGHAHFPFIKPLDHKILTEIADNYDAAITLEDGCIMGGFGSAIAETGLLSQIQLYHAGIPDRFIPHGPTQMLHQTCGLEAKQILQLVHQNNA